VSGVSPDQGRDGDEEGVALGHTRPRNGRFVKGGKRPESPGPRSCAVRRFILRLERRSFAWPNLVWYGASVIFLRGILEGVLERDHLLGIRALPGVSQAMLFIHFPAFYVSAFLLIVLLIHRWSGRGVGTIVTITVKVWPVILLPPLFDALVSGGRGYALGYLGTVTDIETVLRGFWDVSARQLPGVTPGMRVEILIACTCVLAYVATWRGVARGLAAAATVFVGLLALGCVPALGGVGLEGWTQSGGFGNLQSHRFGITYLIIAGVLGSATWRCAAPDSVAAWLRGFRWLRTTLYAGLSAMGIWIAYLLQRPWLDKAFTRPGDWLSAGSAVLAEVLCFQAAAVANDLADAPWDDGSSKRRMLKEGMRHDQARVLWPILAVVGLTLALCVQYAVFLVMLTQLALAGAYSWEPLRLKRLPVAGTAAVATAAVLAVVAGGAAIGREWTFGIIPGQFLGALWLSFFLGFGVKDIADEAADRAAGVRSLPVLLGRRGVPVLAAGTFCAFAAFPFLSGIGILRIPGIALGVAGAAAVGAHRRWSERIALLMLLVGVAGVAAGIRLDRTWSTRCRGTAAPLCESRALERPEDALRYIAEADTMVALHDAIVRAWPLAGLYPWLIPAAAERLEPSSSGPLLGDAGASGVCSGLAYAAMLAPLAQLGRQTEWCHALGGAIAGGREDGNLVAVSAHQADVLGLEQAGDALRRRGMLRWPRSAAVWAEQARWHIVRGEFDQAGRAIRKASKLDPMSAELRHDVEYLGSLRSRSDRERRTMP